MTLDWDKVFKIAIGTIFTVMVLAIIFIFIGV